MASAQLTLAADPRCVGEARRFVVDHLRRWDADAVEFAGVQAVSELATNAVLHARTEFRVRLDYQKKVLRITVSDSSLRRPIFRNYSPEATTGRGLALVQRVSRDWGFDISDGGKAVWCELVPDLGHGGGEPDLDAFLVAEDLDAELLGLDDGSTSPLARAA